jgi:hypothetical protein
MTSAVHPNFIPNGSRGGYRDSASVRRVQRKAERRYVRSLDHLADDIVIPEIENAYDAEVREVHLRSALIWHDADDAPEQFTFDPYAGVFQWSDFR